MSWAETIRAAARNLVRRPLRNGLAILGVVLATATLVALLSLSAGLEQQLLGRLGERPLLTTIQVTQAAPRAGEAPRPLDDTAVAALVSLPGVRDASPVLVVPVTLRLADRAPGGTVLAIAAKAGAPYSLEEGRAPRTDEADAIVLTSAGVRGLGLDARTVTGRALTLELRRGESATARRAIPVRVVGVAGSELPGLAIVPLVLGEDALAWIASGEGDAARDLRLAQQITAALLFGARAVPSQLGSSRYTAIWVEAASAARVREVVREIERLGFAASSNTAAIETVEELFDVVNAALGAIAAIALAVAALGVVNALVTSVAERTAEIGVLKAIGASDATVQRLILAEAAAIGLAGGALGIGVGWLLARLASLAARASAGPGASLEPRLDPGVAAAALGSALALALLAGWLPARRASRLAPAEAFRSE